MERRPVGAALLFCEKIDMGMLCEIGTLYLALWMGEERVNGPCFTWFT